MTSLPAGVRDPSGRLEFIRSLSLSHSLTLSLHGRGRTVRAAQGTRA